MQTKLLILPDAAAIRSVLLPSAPDPAGSCFNPLSCGFIQYVKERCPSDGASALPVLLIRGSHPSTDANNNRC